MQHQEIDIYDQVQLYNILEVVLLENEVYVQDSLAKI